MSKRDKEGRYVIDETNILPDLLEEKKLYFSQKTKELMKLNVYEYFTITFDHAYDNYKLIEVKNEKMAKVLFKDNRQKLPKKE